VLVNVIDAPPAPSEEAIEQIASLPFVLVGITGNEPDERWSQLCDVMVPEDDPALGDIAANLEAHPIATTTFALLLRGQERRTIGDGLVAESSAYSVLQAGPEFEAWKGRRRPARVERDDGPRVHVGRAGNTLVVTLTRPDRLNALDARMRDELVEALTVATADTSISSVEWRGDGRAFCSGGDLNEFGSRSDPASAHLIRLQRSVARVLAHLSQPTTTYIHGTTFGSGIELAAFTDTVVASADTQIALPEIGLGLIPGAGGTVSLPRRIGRQRTAWLGLSGRSIDAETALSWGLVDDVTA
jgi:enoyl-CoA hydratase/carnithine racemase